MWIMMSTWIPLISRPMRRGMTMGILLFDAEDGKAVGWTGEDTIVMRMGGASSEYVN